jgi:hypothetical protein
VLLELSKTLSFFLSLLSLCPVMVSAFFVPGSHWQERLEMAAFRVAFSACVCFASGLLFTWPSRSNPDAGQPLMSTLPVRVFLWALVGLAILFAVSWYIEEYYLPLVRHDCCRRP